MRLIKLLDHASRVDEFTFGDIVIQLNDDSIIFKKGEVERVFIINILFKETFSSI